MRIYKVSIRIITHTRTQCSVKQLGVVARGIKKAHTTYVPGSTVEGREDGLLGVGMSYIYVVRWFRVHDSAVLLYIRYIHTTAVNVRTGAVGLGYTSKLP